MLALGLDVELDAGLVGVVGIGQHERPLASREEPRENLLEAGVDHLEGLKEALAHLAVDGVHDAGQRLSRPLEVSDLRRDVLVARLEPGVLLLGDLVHGSQVGYLGCQLARPVLIDLAVDGGADLERGL